MEERKRYIMKFDIPFYGLIYTIGVTHFEETPPNHSADSDIDYYGETEFEYDVIDCQGEDNTKKEDLFFVTQYPDFDDAVYTEFIHRCERRNLP